MEEFFFRVGGHLFSIVSENSKLRELLPPSLSPFVTKRVDNENLLFNVNIQIVEEPAMQGEEVISFTWDETECQICQDNTSYNIKLNIVEDNSRFAVMSANNDFTETTVYFKQGLTNNSYFLNNYLMMIYAFAAAPHNTLLMHASVIYREGKGFMFLGKSGTGKSTHTGLWLKHIPDSELLNDDNPIVRVQDDGSVIVYGSPWSGKTPCYKNEQAKLAAIVRIVQAPENQIIKEKTAQAFASILPSCSCLKEHNTLYDGVCDTAGIVALKTPIYRLNCLPNEAAAVLCFETTN